MAIILGFCFTVLFSLKDKFLSTKVKYLANLPTKIDRENLQKYYYKRLIDSSKNIFISYVESPIGMIEIKTDEQNILSVEFKDSNKVETSFSENEISKNGKQQLSEYFASERKE